MTTTAPATPLHGVRQPVEGKLDFIWIELTPKCNLTCVHCYADSGPTKPLDEVMSLGAWRDILHEASALGCRSVQFIGGEPTLHPQLTPLIDHCRELGFKHIEVYTNGTVLSPRLKNILTKAGVQLAFSVYSADPAVHDAITGVNGSHKKTLDTIRWARQANLDVRVSFIEMPANAGHYQGTSKVLASVGVSKLGWDQVRGIGRGNELKVSPKPLAELCGRCGNGSLCISSNGEIYPCVFSHTWPVGKASRGLVDALTGTYLKSFRGRLAPVLAQRSDAKKKGPKSPKPQCEPFEPPQCKPKRPVCGPDLPKPGKPGKPEKPAKPACEPFKPPQCKPDRTVCSPDLPPCSPDKPPPPCTPNRPCTPDCVPSACKPQIA